MHPRNDINSLYVSRKEGGTGLTSIEDSLDILHIDLRPSRQSRNRCIRSKISRYNLDNGRVVFDANATLTGCRCKSNNYITRCHREFELIGVSCSWSSSCSSRQCEPTPSRGLGPSGSLVELLWEWERSAAIVSGTGGQYVAFCSVSNSPLTYNPFATLSNKVWEVCFSKEVCLFVIIVDFVSAYICIRIVASAYTIDTQRRRIKDYIRNAKKDWLQRSEITNNTRTKRTTITRKQKWKEKQLYGYFKRQTIEI